MHDIHDNDPDPAGTDFPLVGRLPSIYIPPPVRKVEDKARDSRRPSTKLSWLCNCVCVCHLLEAGGFFFGGGV